MRRRVLSSALFWAVAVVASAGLYGPAKQFVQEFVESVQAARALERMLGGNSSCCLGELDPALSSNQYMPEFLSGNLRWIKKKRAEGQLKILLNSKMRGPTAARVENGMIFMFVRSAFLLDYMADYDKGNELLRRGIRSSIATRLSHDVLHLRQRDGYPLYRRPFVDKLEEEMFIQALLSSRAVEPLVAGGQLITQDDLETITVLRRCNGTWLECPEFRDWVKPLYSGHE